jgi:hypothetical protein
LGSCDRPLIDAFVDSHYHEDHFGWIDDLVKMGVPVLESYGRGRRDLVPAADKNNGTFKDYMQAVGEDAHAMKRGDVIIPFTKAWVLALSPR